MTQERNVANWFVLLILIIVLKQLPISGKEFYCKNGKKIKSTLFCDGKKNCAEGSDELNNNSISGHYISCAVPSRNTSCLLHRDYYCNKTVTCQGLTPCDVGCASHYKCQNSNKCVRRTTVCDGHSCNGCPEDDEWETGIGFQCVRSGRRCRLPQQLLWDNVKDCDDGSDLCYKSTGVIEDGRDIRRGNPNPDSYKCFKCVNSSVIIPRSKVCDAKIDCPDLSDECLCERRQPGICMRVNLRASSMQRKAMVVSNCKVGEISCFRKNSSLCISRSQVCDGKVNCPNRRDERHNYCGGTLPCDRGREEAKGKKCRCRTPCVSQFGRLCDGVADCPVATLRETVWDFPPGYPADECRADCQLSSGFNCTNPSHSLVKLSTKPIVCQTYRSSPYPNGTRKIHTFTLKRKHRCDGKLKCDANYADERNCSKRFPCANRNGRYVSIHFTKVCDGYVDCDNGQDETRELCKERFFCPVLRGSRVSIKLKHVCDYVINCDEAEDEMGCEDSDGRFYCEGGHPLFVRKTLMFDGVGDCKDWSDECPTTVVPGSENLLSSRYELIGNPILRAFVWIMAILALIGNSIVIRGEIETVRLFSKQNKSASLITNHMLVLNLAVADFLMAIYLLMLGIIGVVYKGSYCAQSLSWLTSNTCALMGIVIVLSSQTSTITMILLTCARLYAVLKPIESTTTPRPKFMLIPIACAWIIAMSLAIIPLSHTFEETFVEKALLEDHLFFKSVVVHIDSAKSFTERLLTYSPQFAKLTESESTLLMSATSWHEFEDIMEALNVSSTFIKFIRYFGYYSANSVCIPNLFVTREDRAWKYSLSISISNFLAFMFVFGAYVVIMVKATRSAKLQGKHSGVSNSNKEIQRKIIRLIFTDFCCWIPLSIMVFVNFSGVKIDSVSYAVAAVVLLPINSALNPILYSNFIDTIWEKIRKKWTESKATTSKGGSGIKWIELLPHK